jgi:HK97 family phage portal protein
MSVRSAISRAITKVAQAMPAVLKAIEGGFHEGPYYLPYSGGWLPQGADTNWWQEGHYVQPLGTRQAVVEACVSAYSQTIAMCPGDHWRLNTRGGRERVKNSALSRLLRKPNAYQTMSDFMLNLTRQLYLDGNAYALALRNDRFEVAELHLMDSRLSFPRVAPETGDVFYRLHGNAVVQYMTDGLSLMVPQRDVLHIHLHADRNRRYPFPLWGQTPLLAALTEMGLSETIMQQQSTFYNNQARPSAILSTDLILDKDQVQALRDRWDEQSKGLNQGRTPIMTAGLKVQPWGSPGRDAQIAEILKIAEQHIALAFRVPMQILGLGGTSFHSTEALMQFWIATGLGFALNQIEEAFGLLFMLKGQPEEYVEFDTQALLRSAQKDRIEALARGVQSGIYSPNEARETEGLERVKFGDEPRVQQQVVPLSAASTITTPSPGAHGPHPPPAPGPDAPPAAPKKPGPEDVQRQLRNLHDGIARARRRFG